MDTWRVDLLKNKSERQKRIRVNLRMVQSRYNKVMEYAKNHRKESSYGKYGRKDKVVFSKALEAYMRFLEQRIEDLEEETGLRELVERLEKLIERQKHDSD